jgi:predicted transcriptional regulator
VKKEIKASKRVPKIGVNGLSALEADIMNIVWENDTITVRDIHEVILSQGYIPYTTVMATMNNMAQKGLLRQNRNSKAYLYSAAISRDAMAESIVETVVNRVLGGVSTPILSYLLDMPKEEDIEKILKLKDELNQSN